LLICIHLLENPGDDPSHEHLRIRAGHPRDTAGTARKIRLQVTAAPTNAPMNRCDHAPVGSDTQSPVDVTSGRQPAGHERSAPPPHEYCLGAGSDAIELGRSGRYPLRPRSSMARPTASGTALWTPANARTRGRAWCRGKPPPSTRDSIPLMRNPIALYRTSTVVHMAGPVKPVFRQSAPQGLILC
jgi:hypothetical protein